MRKQEQKNLPECLAYKAARYLPRKYRAEYLAVWLAEMNAIESPDDRLAYAEGLRQAARQTRRELDPEEALVTGLIWGICAAMPFIYLLGDLMASVNLHLLAMTLPWMLGVMLLTNLSTRAVLVLPELKKVWWRKVMMGAIALGCGYLALAFLTWQSANHPSTFLLMVASAVTGGAIARHYHKPRPVLNR